MSHSYDVQSPWPRSSSRTAPGLDADGVATLAPIFDTTEAVIAALTGPLIAEVEGAAGRLSPLTPAALSGLERAARGQLESIKRELRAQLAAQTRAIEERRACCAGIDLPAAMRDSVDRQRGARRTGSTA